MITKIKDFELTSIFNYRNSDGKELKIYEVALNLALAMLNLGIELIVMKANIDNVNYKNDIIVTRKGLMIHESPCGTSIFLKANQKFTHRTRSSRTSIAITTNSLEDVYGETASFLNKESLEDPPKTLYKSNYLSMSREFSSTRVSGITRSNRVRSNQDL